LVLGILAALVIFVTRAAAHAELVRSVPESNAVLAQAPAQVELFFSEGVDPTFSTIKVLNSSAAPVDHQDTRVDPADPTHITVSLPALPDGVYTVSWRALSAADGHVTFGAFPFTVGLAVAGAPAASLASQNQFQLPLASLIAKWLVYLGAAALAGGPLFVLAVWRPALKLLPPDTAPQTLPRVDWSRWPTLALALFFVGLVLNWWSQAGQASGGTLAAPWDPATGQMLFTTRLGTVWLVQAVLGLALAGMLPAAGGYRKERRWPAQAWITLGAAALLLLSVSLASHAAADPNPILPVAADWIHLMAAAVWMGGLTHFAVGLWALRASAMPARERTEFTARLIPRFLALALTSVALLTLTGVYSAYLRIGTLQALVSTLYGGELLLKLAVAMVMVAMGAINLLIVTPNMQRGGQSPAGNLPLLGRFRGLVTGEVTLGAILLLSVSLLTLLPPAQPPAAAGLTGSAKADDVQVDLAITPGQVGVNNFRVRLMVNGQPVNNAKSVGLQFTPTNANLPPSQAQLVAVGQGEYDVVGGFLGFPDSWQVIAVVRREGKFDAYAYFNYVVGVATAAAPFPWNKASGLALMGLALTYLFAANHLSRSRNQLLLAGLVPTAALALAALAVFYDLPVKPVVSQINPVAADAASIARGQALYNADCQPCHGTTGKGDGPVGLTLNPRPADLTAHAVPGVHTDAQLFDWITNGYSSSRMPAFGQRLSDNDRWDLVNFIRTFAPRKP
jgi:copper transport protein